MSRSTHYASNGVTKDHWEPFACSRIQITSTSGQATTYTTTPPSTATVISSQTNQELQGGATNSSGQWKDGEDQLGRPSAQLLPRPALVVLEATQTDKDRHRLQDHHTDITATSQLRTNWLLLGELLTSISSYIILGVQLRLKPVKGTFPLSNRRGKPK